VVFDPADPLFAQSGEDGRTASAGEGERRLAELEEHLAQRVLAHLGDTAFARQCEAWFQQGSTGYPASSGPIGSSGREESLACDGRS
jgi:hypothetical protein